MLPLLMLNAALAQQTTATPYEQGVAALATKDAQAAIGHFKTCLRDDPKQLDCHWEIGWAYWLEGDWGEVVTHWSTVRDAEPDREGLSRYLSQARDNLSLEALLARGREAAPDSFRSTAPEGAKLRLRAVGDMMIGTDFPSADYLPAQPAAMFDGVADLLRDADVTFGNLEGPLCDGGETQKCRPDATPGSCYAFRSPGRYAEIFKAAGFDVVSTANNHASDFGQACRVQTEEHLDRVGIKHSGRPGDIASLESNGLKIAVIGFHTSRSCHYVNDHETAADLVRALSTDHDIVVVSFHGGAEGGRAIHIPDGPETFYGEDRGDLRAFAHTVVDAGADLVIGHGPHVLRGVEIYGDRLIAYSLGNFATYGRFNLSGNSGLGVVLDVTLDREGRFASGALLPTRQEGAGIPVKDDDGKAVDLMRMLSEEDFPQTGVQVARDGSLARRGR
ncbi:MAG: poly-gamma-glutamate capsule biosynthesis protein CapA/YwtB (metallophosphatase superfamily) [Myxococcota bacterium]|jgi:poly-gamma-glutamate capsule biosynthesis protein CapA/YwtB (metallophosphatase superfamily)